jgi:predicted PurR-regulated permease PerM
MISRVLAAIRGIPGAIWRSTLGRFFTPRESHEPMRNAMREPDEPQSVAGITVRVTLIVVGIGLALVLAYQLRVLLILVFLGILFAAGLYAPARFLERRGVGSTLSVVIVFLVFLGVLGLVVFLIFPPLVRQAVELTNDLPSLFGRLRESAISFIDGLAGDGSGADVIDSLTNNARDALPGLTSLISVPLTVLGILVNVFVILFLSALLLIERDGIRRWTLQFFDPSDRASVDEVAERALGKLGAFVRGQLVLMTSIGIGSGLGMLVVGLITSGEPLPFIFPLSLLAFITEAIPMVGPFIAGVPIVLVALINDPLSGLFIGIWLIVLQQLEGYVLVPIVQGRAVALSPIVVLLAVLAGGSLAGVVGAIIAIPVVAVLDVVIKDVVLPLRRRAMRGRSGTPAEGEA